jgi:hypothetical protein
VSFRKSLEFGTEGNKQRRKKLPSKMMEIIEIISKSIKLKLKNRDETKVKVSNSTLIQNSNSLFNSFNSSLKILPQFYFKKLAASGKFHETVLVVSRAEVPFSSPSSRICPTASVHGDKTYWLLQLVFRRKEGLIPVTSAARYSPSTPTQLRLFR